MATPKSPSKREAAPDAVLSSGGTYADYLASKPTGEPMTRERRDFVRKNLRTDATESLDALARAGTPTLDALAEFARATR